MHVIVLASGKGERLASFHNNHFPKILLKAGRQTMLDNILQHYSRYDNVDGLTIVAPSLVDRDMIEEHIKAARSTNPLDPYNKLSIWVQYYPYSDGSFSALVGSFTRPITDTLITWCDICPTQKLDIRLEDGQNAIVFTDNTNNSNYRGTFSQNIHGKMVADLKPYTHAEGNVPGLFYFKDLFATLHPSLLDELSKDQEADLFSAIKIRLEKQDDPGIIARKTATVDDIGTPRGYKTYNFKHGHIPGRPHNLITIQDQIVNKSSATDITSLVNELAWYESISKLIDQNDEYLGLPTVHDTMVKRTSANGYMGYDMDYIDGVTLDRVNVDLGTKMHIGISSMLKFHNMVDKHGSVTTEDFGANHFIEYIDRTVSRVNKIMYLIPKDTISLRNPLMSDEMMHVQAQNPQFLMSKVADFLKARYAHVKDNWAIIHGDLNPSNMIVTPCGQTFIIDPRNDFAGLPLYGDRYADYAKMIYGFMGYCDFNRVGYIEEAFNDNHLYKPACTVPDIHSIESILIYAEMYLPDDIDMGIIMMLIGVFFYRLSGCYPNDPAKAIVAHFTGIAIIQSVLEDQELFTTGIKSKIKEQLIP